MNSIVKKILLISFVLLLTACVHYPSRPAYYAAPVYRSAYMVEHRNYYAPSPHRYQKAYRPGKAYLPRQPSHHQHDAAPRWHNDGPKQPHGHSHEGKKNRH